MMPLEKLKDVLQLFMNQIDDHQPGKCSYSIVFILAMGMCNVAMHFWQGNLLFKNEGERNVQERQ